jgi:hypothetical protein
MTFHDRTAISQIIEDIAIAISTPNVPFETAKRLWEGVSQRRREKSVLAAKIAYSILESKGNIKGTFYDK